MPAGHEPIVNSTSPYPSATNASPEYVAEHIQEHIEEQICQFVFLRQKTRITALEDDKVELTQQFASQKVLLADVTAALSARIAALEADNTALVEALDHVRNAAVEPVSPGGHDYVGPTKRDPDTGRRTPVSDEPHERFHRAVGDVISGRIIPEARRQMQEALKNAPKETTSIPTDGPKDDPRRVGFGVRT